MSKKQILIPTRGRVSNQITYNLFSDNFKEKYDIRIVCPKEEAKAHKKLNRKIIVSPIEGIGKKRQWIMDRAKRKLQRNIIMCDDDIRLFKRKSQKAFNLRKVSQKETEEFFEKMFELNKKYSLVGVSARTGNNRLFPNKIVYATRQYGIYAIDVRIFFKINARFDNIDLMEDFDVVLTFLENGYKNAVFANWAWDQVSNSSGGCSIYRNYETQEKAAIRLKELHPDFVTVVDKKVKGSWKGFENRKDVRIQWKKAYKSSGEK